LVENLRFPVLTHPSLPVSIEATATRFLWDLRYENW